MKISRAAIVAIILIGVCFALSREPSLSSAGRLALAQQFKFSSQPLFDWDGLKHKTEREVNPSLKRLSAWMSGLGAAVSIGDLDGDGLENDIVHVDPRTDTVTVQSAPGFEPPYSAFTLEAKPCGFAAGSVAPTGALLCDLNEDGLQDIVVHYWGRSPQLFVRQKGHLASDAFKALELLPKPERWYTNAATVADFDGDAHLDLLFANYFPDHSEILDCTSSRQEKLHDTKARAFNGGTTRFFLWAGCDANNTPRFNQVCAPFSEKIACAWKLAVGAVDLNGDLLPELYFANDLGPDRLLLNQSSPGKLRFSLLAGRRTLDTPASFVLGQDSFKGMGVDFCDINADGMADIFVSNITSAYGLHESNMLWLSSGGLEGLKSGKAPYVQMSEKLGLSRSGWSWDCRVRDFNNDGTEEVVIATGFCQGKINRWPELQAAATINSNLMDNPANWPAFRQGDDVSGREYNAFFVKDSTGRYHNIGKEIGFSRETVSRAVAIADVDADGDLDMAVANQWQPSHLMINESPTAGKALELYLVHPALSPSEASVWRAQCRSVSRLSASDRRVCRSAPWAAAALGARASSRLWCQAQAYKDAELRSDGADGAATAGVPGVGYAKPKGIGAGHVRPRGETPSVPSNGYQRAEGTGQGSGIAVKEVSALKTTPYLAAIGSTATMLDAGGRKRFAQVDGGSGHSGRSGKLIHFGLGPHDGHVSVLVKWRSLSGKVLSRVLTLRPGVHVVELPRG